MNSKATIVQGFCIPCNQIKKIFPKLSLPNLSEEKIFINDLNFYSAKFMLGIKNNKIITDGWIFFNSKFIFLQNGYIVSYYNDYPPDAKLFFDNYLVEYINYDKVIDTNHPWDLELEKVIIRLDEIITFLPTDVYNNDNYLGIIKNFKNSCKLTENSDYINIMRKHFQLENLDSGLFLIEKN